MLGYFQRLLYHRAIKGFSVKNHPNYMSTLSGFKRRARIKTDIPRILGYLFQIVAERKFQEVKFREPQMNYREVVNLTILPFLSKVIRAKW